MTEPSEGGREMIRRRERRDDIVPRNHWGPLWSNPLSMLNDMDRIFDDFRSDWESLFAVPRTPQGSLVRQPLVDLADEGKEYIVKAEVPGIEKDNISIEVTDAGIEISGETRSEREESDDERGYLKRERTYAKFHRSLPFPEKVLPDKADAALKDGILTVKVPKAAAPDRKAKKVQVK
jgi:HSP20 family protein